MSETKLQQRYRIGDRLGEGGMGIVYRAQDTLLDRPVALKSVSKENLSEARIERLLAEARSAARLNHPGVVAVYDVIEEGETRHIVMEYVEGETFESLGRLPWREAATLLEQVLDALDFAHGQGVLHRDLKPDNLIRTPEGRAKVMDFGLAVRAGDPSLTRTGAVYGSPLYLAPELARGGEPSPASDLYSLGCVFYQLLTGEPPFAGTEPLAVIQRHLVETAKPPVSQVHDLPPALDALVLKLLAKDPEERPRSAAQALEHLREILRAPSETTVLDTGTIRPGTHLRRSALVGRQGVLDRIAGRLQSLGRTEPNIVLVSGEPGIGKSRLIDEVVTAARVRGASVLVGRCHERDRGVPYLPVANAVESFARHAEPERWRALLEASDGNLYVLISDSVLKHLPELGDRPSRDHAMTVERVQSERAPLRAMSGLVTELTQDGPVLLVFDDLHWADGSTLDLLFDLARQTREMPVLYLGAYREVELERTHPLSRLLVELNRERLLVRERLGRFTPDETRALLASLLGEEAAGAVADAVHEQTEGNAFFVEEVVQGLVEGGSLVWDSDARRYALAPGTAVERLAAEVPQGVRAAIGARLDRLDPDTQQVLSLAAVIGRRFDTDVLVEVARRRGLDRAQVEDALERAEAAHFVSPVEQESEAAVDGFTAGSVDLEADFAFDHALIQQAIYNETSRRQRRALHTEVGAALEATYPGRESLYSERLAYHFLEGEDDAKAVHYGMLAGDKMIRVYYESDLALSYYLPALEVAVREDAALRRLYNAASALHLQVGDRKLGEERRREIVSGLGDLLRAVRPESATRSLGELAPRISAAALDFGEVYEMSVRLQDEALRAEGAERLEVETEQGKVVSILELPEGPGPFPVVFCFHGSLTTKEVLAGPARQIRERGLGTLRVDLPGFGETTVISSSSGEIVQPLRKVIDAVLAHDRVDSRGVGLIGWSLGPWYAAHLAARDERVRAVVSMSGIFDAYDPEDLAGESFPDELFEAWARARYEMGLRPVPGVLPPSPDNSCFLVADRIRCPVLLVYGSIEPPVYRVQGERMAKALPNARAQVWKSGVHVLRNIPEAYENACDWLREQLLDAPR